MRKIEFCFVWAVKEVIEDVSGKPNSEGTITKLNQALQLFERQIDCDQTDLTKSNNEIEMKESYLEVNFRKSGYRAVVILEGASIEKEVDCKDFNSDNNVLYNVHVIVDRRSKYWYPKPHICGIISIIEAPKLTGIAPVHYSPLYKGYIALLNGGLDTRALTTDQASTLSGNVGIFYINSLVDAGVFCEPSHLFKAGWRRDRSSIRCFDCIEESECDFFKLDLNLPISCSWDILTKGKPPL